MENIKFPEIQFLKARIEAKWGGRLETPKDFELLAEEIFSKSKGAISTSTLKRVWGYDKSKSATSLRMLDILAGYVGFSSFRSFQNSLKKNSAFSSSFLTTSYIESCELKKGEHIILGWNPNRLVELEYLGKDRYRVVSNKNSKLREKDEFAVSAFIQGYPMYISHIERDGEKTSMYAAGVKDGLTVVQKVQGSQPR